MLEYNILKDTNMISTRQIKLKLVIDLMKDNAISHEDTAIKASFYAPN